MTAIIIMMMLMQIPENSIFATAEEKTIFVRRRPQEMHSKALQVKSDLSLLDRLCANFFPSIHRRLRVFCPKTDDRKKERKEEKVFIAQGEERKSKRKKGRQNFFLFNFFWQPKKA